MNTDVLLRDVMEDDLPIFYEQQLDAEATAVAAFPARDRESFMSHWHKIMGNESVILKTILFNGQVAGIFVSWEQSGEREVGYWIGKEYWGKVSLALTVFLLSRVSVRLSHDHIARNSIASIAPDTVIRDAFLTIRDHMLRTRNSSQRQYFAISKSPRFGI